MNTEHLATLDAVAGFALQAHTLAAADRPRRSRRKATIAHAIVELTRHAIDAWRGLAGMDNSRDIDPAAVNNAVQLIGAQA